jgi:hypothetical protein
MGAKKKGKGNAEKPIVNATNNQTEEPKPKKQK